MGVWKIYYVVSIKRFFSNIFLIKGICIFYMDIVYGDFDKVVEIYK